MTMQSLHSNDRRALEKRIRELQRGDGLTQNRLDELTAEWEPKVQPDAKEKAENFGIVTPEGVSTGVVGPRWAFHLFGLRHRAAEIAFHTESGLVLLQRRSPTKEDWPNALDMAVAGHIPQNEDGSDLTWEAGAWKELDEEIGLNEKDAAETLAEGRLLPIGESYFALDVVPERNPAFTNAEVRQIFAATLTGAGLSRLRFPDQEVAGLLLVTPETAWELLAHEPIASGLRYSLPRYLDWFEKHQRQNIS